MLRLESIIFDLDGTLWDTCPSCAIGWNNVVRQNEIPFRPITADDVRSVAGMPHDECIRHVFKGLTEDQLKIITKETSKEDNRIVTEMGGNLYPGVSAGLSQLSQHFRLFIVSNCQTGYIETFLNWTGFTPYFQDFECWRNTKLSKSKNIIALKERNNIKEGIYIGDTIGDSQASRDSNTPFVFVEYGFGTCSDYVCSFTNFNSLVTYYTTRQFRNWP